MIRERENELAYYTSKLLINSDFPNEAFLNFLKIREALWVLSYQKEGIRMSGIDYKFKFICGSQTEFN